jgi:peptidyl-prolyl cis-trans isomerase A (cyclophilin A)
MVPMTVANFIGLATGQKAWKDPRDGSTQVGVPLYDGVAFHRVIPGFMIQAGDPLGTGAGDPGYEFANEIDESLRHDRPGMLAMANAGPGTNGSQFYILEAAQSHLDGGYTVFGACGDIGVISAIAAVPTTSAGKPLDPVVIQKVTITR